MYRRVAILLVCCSLVGVGVMAMPSGSPGYVAAAENESADMPRHVHPDEIGENGDLEMMQEWLARWMSGSLNEGGVELGEREYELARAYLDENYDHRLDQYAEIAAETDLESLAEQFGGAQEKQLQLTDRVERFEQLLEEYETAIDEGDEERAKDIARELDVLAEEIDGMGDELLAEYDELEALADLEFAESRSSVELLQADTQRDRSRVVSASLEETETSVDVEQDAISFVDPLVATGHVQTIDGEPVDGGTVELVIGPDHVRTTTDADGTFAATLRPVLAPLDASAVTARFIPASGSPYLGSNATGDVSISQVSPTVSVDVNATTWRVGDTIRVDGTLAVAEIGVEGGNIELIAEGETLGSLTVSDGTFAGTVTVPAHVPAGETQMRAVFDEGNVAVGPGSDEVTVDVQETPTALTIDVEETEDGISVAGVLEMDGGDPVAQQPVTLEVVGGEAMTVETDVTGAFVVVLVMPVDAEDEVLLVADFSGEGTNLGASSASASIAVGSSGSMVNSIWTIVVLAVVLGGGAVWWVFRRDVTPERRQKEAEPEAVALSSKTSPPPDTVDGRDLLDDDPDAAVAVAYTSLRRRMASDRTDAAMTHWEFYRANARSEMAEVLRTLTTVYERAVFSATGVSTDEAREAIAIAESIGPGD